MLSTITSSSSSIIKKISNSKPNPHGGRRRTRIGRRRGILFVCGWWSFVSPPPHFLFNGVFVTTFSCFLAASQIVAVPTNSSNTSSTLINGTISPSSSLSLLNSDDNSTSTTHKKHPVDHLKLGIAIGASSLSALFLISMAAAALFTCCFRFIKLRRRRSRSKLNLERVAAITTTAPPEEEEEKKAIVQSDGPRRFTWDEMERFSSNFSSVIGSGGFSTVYLSQFPDSSVGAIKIHSASSERLNRVYKQELEILLGLRHDNIVKLIGYCDDREEGVLVFEYVPNGNLQEKLHPETTTEVLSWNSRMKIAFQLAQALEYLHHKCPLQIVHGDIKPSNILLDQHLNCKLCDFGSAKMGFSSTVLPPSSSSSTAAAAAINRMMLGSPGYTDPHYLRTGIASKKNDVYSFGVILLELITGREALCSRTGQRLTSIAGPMLRDASKVAQMMDARLLQSQHHHHQLRACATTHSQLLLEQVQAVASISAMCLCDSPTLRPSASDILHAFATRIPFTTITTDSKR